MSSPSPIIEETSWWRGSRETPVMLVTPLSREECVRRLRDSVDPWWKPFGRPVMGKVSEDGAVLRHRTWYRNSFQTLARLSFGDNGSGTRIACRFGMSQLVMVMMAVWAVMIVAGFTVFLMTPAWSEGTAEIPALPFILMPVALIVGIGIAWLVGRNAARADKQFLTEFLRTTLSANESA